MRRILLAIGIVALLGLLAVGALVWRVAVPVGTGFGAKAACTFHFVSGMDLEDGVLDYIRAEVGPMSDAIRVEIDDTAGLARASAWLHTSVAVHRPGVGCTLVVDGSPEALRAQQPTEPEERRAAIAAATPGAWPGGRGQPEVTVPAGLEDAFEAAFSEPAGGGRATLAALVVHRGGIVAERYAATVGPETPLPSWSMAKSVTGALVGIAVGEGLFELSAPADVGAWPAADPRHPITLDQLLRMSSGLAFEETYQPGDDATTMLYDAGNMAAYAATRPLSYPPDSHWSYSSGTTNLLMGLLKGAVGGSLDDLWAFTWSRLFGPLGMTSAIFEPDPSGTFVGSSYLFATARDWARFGELFLRDGVWNGVRLLPRGWVGYSRTATPASLLGGYGAQWWLNAGAPGRPEERPWPGLPPDAYAARGHSGQYVLVVPSRDLVVVRHGLSAPGADHGFMPLAAAAVAWADTQPSPAEEGGP
jgi:CubicO group peptidase (beta-lactamase class C family)